ncbi:MAG: NADH dehydrogenase [Legionellaceae bacterium]|nr:NADH dehydrogenase [Legionellaceae bacterium]
MMPEANLPHVATLLLSMALCTPLLCSILVLTCYRPFMIHIAPWAAFPALLAALMVPTGSTIEWNWVLLGTRLGIDSTSQIFLFFTALLWLVAGIFACASLAADPRRHAFFRFYLLAMSGNIGLTLAQDIASFYAFFALLSFSSYAFVVHNQTPEAFRAARIYMSFVVLGELMLFAGFVLSAAMMGTIRLPVAPGLAWSPLLMTLLFFGFGIKAGVVPLHVWLPLAHPVAPTAASAVLSGAIIKAGLLGWLRFLPLGEIVWPEWGNLLLGLGLAAAGYATLVGVTQTNPKTVLAYSSISQVGLITLAVGAAFLAPDTGGDVHKAVLLYSLHHSLAKGALFLGVAVSAAAGATGKKWILAVLLLVALALAGAPFSSGMIAKAALKSLTLALPGQWGVWLPTLLSLAAAGSTLLMARFLYLLWWQKTEEGALSAGLWLPWLALSAASATIVFLWPAATALSPDTASALPWLAALGPIGCGALIACGVCGIARYCRLPYPAIPAGDMVVVGKAFPVLWRRCRQSARRLRTLVPSLPAAMLSDVFRQRRTSASLPVSAEILMRKWPIFGLLLLFLTLALIVLLNISSSFPTATAHSAEYANKSRPAQPPAAPSRANLLTACQVTKFSA